MRVQLHCQQHYGAKAEARFLERKHQLDQVVYSLLRVRSKGLARELFLQLQDGESNMADLSTQFSEGPERATRGIVGPVPLAQAHPQLMERLRTAPAGELQEPFQVDQWWLVVRLESLRPASFDQRMSLQMSQELFDQWLEQEVDRKVDQLRSLVLPAMAGSPA
jgi:parvulin-like peptidyl-prolyl isomerase